MSLPQYTVNRDKSVKLYLNDNPVSNSTAMSQYARPLNIKGSGITATPNDTLGTFDVNFPNTTVPITAIANVGTGTGLIYRDVTSNTANLKSLKAGSSNITITNNADDITIDVPSSGGSNTLNPHATSKDWGTFIGGGFDNQSAGIKIGDGMFSGYMAFNEFDSGLDSNGVYSRFITTTTSGSQSYYSAPVTKSGATAIAVTSLSLNPNFWIKVKYADITNLKTFIGFYNTSPPSTAGNFLNNIQGFGLLYNAAANTTWQIENNNGAATNTVTSTSVTLANNTIYTINIVGDSANNRWGVSINGGAMTYMTTAIPTSSVGVGFIAHVTTNTTATRSMDLYWVYGEQSA